MVDVLLPFSAKAAEAFDAAVDLLLSDILCIIAVMLIFFRRQFIPMISPYLL